MEREFVKLFLVPNEFCNEFLNETSSKEIYIYIYLSKFRTEFYRSKVKQRRFIIHLRSEAREGSFGTRRVGFSKCGERKKEKEKRKKRGARLNSGRKRERKKGWKVYFAFPERASLN